MQSKEPSSPSQRQKSTVVHRGREREQRDAPEESFEAAVRADRVVGRLLKRGVLAEHDARAAWTAWIEASEAGLRLPFWRLLTVTPEVDPEPVYAEAARIYAFTEAAIADEADVTSFIERNRDAFSEEDWDRLIELFAVPIAREREKRSVRWVFASHDPARAELHQALASLVPAFEIRFAPQSTVASIIATAFLTRNEYLDRLQDAPPVFDFGTTFERDGGLVDEEQLEAEIKRSSLINLFEGALVESVKRGASDIHIFPNGDGHVEIHFRIDGELVRWHREDRVRPEAFLAVVKDHSMGVDRFERDTAQDGFIQRSIDDVLIRFRVSVLPIASARQDVRAESIVIRVLDDRKVLTDLRKVGLLDVAFRRFQQAIREPHGMVILTGPTGSGKSTTLVAALHQVITPKVNVLTVEDPVEYIIRGVRQIKLSNRLDLDGALRAILRHDPDIVMVGEMRDRQTAEMAIKLANTGHLTFSSLHTNDAPSAVTRLYKMGVEPFLIAYAINIVVAQRLIRKVCSTCREVDDAPDFDLMGILGFPAESGRSQPVYRAGRNKECPTCRGIGYKGRRAIAETMLFSPGIRRLIVTADDMIDEDRLRAQAVEEGMLTLRDSARELVRMGETTLDELMRVTGAG